MTEKLHSILEAEGLASLLSKFTDQAVTDSILGDLTDADLKDLGIEKLGERKRILAAFGKSGAAAVAVTVVEEPSMQSSSSVVSSSNAASPTAATKEQPFVNSLGIPFVPIPRFETRFAVWPVRVQDYEAYCMASGAKFPEVSFSQESDHPIVGVSWNDSIEFCVWLTGKEREEGKIDEKTVYRLPTDLEWSAAVGLPHEPEATPEERHLKAPGYPWGLRWPPPQNAGNYEHQRDDQLGLGACAEYHKTHLTNSGEVSYTSQRSPRDIVNSIENAFMSWKKAWHAVDEFEFTSSVGNFPPNLHGLYDLGGNVWEFCMDAVYKQDGNEYKIARGASYGLGGEWKVVPGAEDWGAPYITIENRVSYMSSYRRKIKNGEKSLSYKMYKMGIMSPDFDKYADGGFRLCIATSLK
jgi:formylglycine-generating enzyme required for sulfatase activity